MGRENWRYFTLLFEKWLWVDVWLMESGWRCTRTIDEVLKWRRLYEGSLSPVLVLDSCDFVDRVVGVTDDPRSNTK